MNDYEKQISELKSELARCSDTLAHVLADQDKSSRLLIRRDLALTRASDQLKALDDAKSEFISIAAHQLRTPLSAIKWILNMLVNDEFKDEDERKQFVEKAAQSTDRLINLVNDLLAVDHAQSGKDQFIFAPLSITPIFKSVLSEANLAIEKKDLTIDIGDLGNFAIVGDQEKIRAVFQNLIENAIKYNKPHGSIIIKGQSMPGSLQISVSNTGIGIPKNQQVRIFSKFFRAPNAIQLETVGSGLGLFIVKQIIDRHGGKVWFESTEDQGATFYILLPLARADTVENQVNN